AIAHAFQAQGESATDERLGDGVVFIVDVPGGAAELEALLGAHPHVAPGGATTLLGDVIAEESRRRGMAFPAWVAATTAADWQRLGGSYLQRNAAIRGTRTFLADRSPALPALLGAA